MNFIRDRWKGVAVALLIAAAATFLSEHYGAPTMLFALLIGLAVSFLAEQDALQSGLSFSAKTLLRIGVGLLGLQLSFDQVQQLGIVSVSAVFGMVLATLGFGIVLSFLSSRRLAYGILSGGAVAVCGASAALAFSSVLPAHPQRQNDTLLVVISVTVLSTIAMVLYPILFHAMNYDALQTGFLIGATIHDVAQVVGAGYSVSDEAGLIATLVKMLRVACLPVLVLAVHFVFKDSQSSSTPFPWFLILFAVLAVMRSVLPIPEAVIELTGEVSRWMLVTAIAALGLKTDLAAVLRVHPALLVILALETLFILGLGILFAGQYLT
ncbi:MAG: putative sulfate exporter family transporter [Octadecabacter sp.]|nr:putative sulfate exporter family transporter [Octadecabacter sp.]